MQEEKPEENEKFITLVNKLISKKLDIKNILGQYIVRNCGQVEVVDIMNDIDSFYNNIKSNYPKTAKEILTTISKYNFITEILKILKKFSSQDSNGKVYAQIVSKYNENSGFFEDLRGVLGITEEPKLQESQEDNDGREIQKSITSLYEKLRNVLRSLADEYLQSKKILKLYNYKGLKSFTHQKPSVPSKSKETLKKKYYILTSKNNSFYSQQEDKDNLEEKTKIAFSSPPNPSPPPRNDIDNKHKRQRHLSANKMSDQDLGMEFAEKAGSRVSNIMRNLIAPSFTNSPEEKLKKLKYFLMAIKLQGINKKESEFNSLLKSDDPSKLKSDDPSNSLNYQEAKNFSKLFQRASKKEGFLTGRVADMSNINEDNIVGMRTKRIPLILVIELARKMLNSDEFNGFMEFQKKIFKIPANALSADSSAALAPAQQQRLGTSA